MTDSTGVEDVLQVEEAKKSSETMSRRVSVDKPQEREDLLRNGQDETQRLRALAAEVHDQDELERNIGHQVGI